jgi:hypothetical protein
MEIGKAFTYPFEDPDWLKKIGLAAVIFIIPIVGSIAVAGWGVEVARRVIHREQYPLPDWSDFMGHLVRGLKMVVITLVYMLPVILVSACSSGLITFGQNQGENAILTIMSIVSACLGCLVLIYAILAGLVLPAALGKFAATDDLKAAFRFGEVIGMVRAKPMVFVMTLLGGFVASLVGSLGTIVCVIGALFTLPYSIAISGHLWGQAYLEAGQDQSFAPTMQM